MGLCAGTQVLMVDDVVTTGGSILKAAGSMEGHGAVVDREAAQNLAEQGIGLAAIFKRRDFPEI
jgi:orotate phosphoribosyltransferase